MTGLSEQESRPENSGQETGPTTQETLVQVEGRISSPLLPPAILRAYGDVISNAPERFMVMLEKENSHRRFVQTLQLVGGIGLGGGLLTTCVLLGGYPGGLLGSVVVAVGGWLFYSRD